MKARALIAVLATGVMALVLSACGVEQAVDVKQLMAQPKAYVGSETCKMCHLEHFDSSMMTLHSRMTQDAQKTGTRSSRILTRRGTAKTSPSSATS